MYKNDFQIERDDRVKAHEMVEDYKFQLKKLQQKFTEMEEKHKHQRAELHVLKAANARLLSTLSSSSGPSHSEYPPALPPKVAAIPLCITTLKCNRYLLLNCNRYHQGRVMNTCKDHM